MEMINKLVSESRILALKEEEARRELAQLKSEMFFEEQTLSSLRAEVVKLQDTIKFTRQHISLQSQQRQHFKQCRDTIKQGELTHYFMRRFVEETESTGEEQEKKLAAMKANYERMLKNYETSPSYLAIVREEAKERELSELIDAKKKELMKLETEQEY